jgi:transcriptional regulator with XRE-family HTH domain
VNEKVARGRQASEAVAVMTGPDLPPIGERLRQARLRRGLSVRGLARSVELSASLISQIETGKSSPSVSTLYAVTTALGVSIEDVFGQEPGQRTGGAVALVGSGVAAGDGATRPTGPLPPDTDRDRRAAPTTAPGNRLPANKRRVGPFVGADEREVLQLDSGVTWELLGQLPDAAVEFLRVTYAPGGSSSGADTLMRHSGTEWGHLLSGELTLTLAFDTYRLGPGDSVSFDSSTPHSYANHGTVPAVGIWFVAERFG